MEGRTKEEEIQSKEGLNKKGRKENEQRQKKWKER